MPDPPSHAESPGAIVYNDVQLDFEYIQVWRLQKISGQEIHVLVLGHPQNEKFLSAQRELLVLQFVPIASDPVTAQC